MKGMMRIIRKAIMLFSLALCVCVNAQQQDFQSRLGLGVSSTFADNWGWSLDAQQRWFQNSTTFDRTIINPGVSYSPQKYLKVALAYRLTWLNSSILNQEVKQRVNIDITLQHKIDRLRLSYRSRFQYGFDDFQTVIVSAPLAFKWRHKVAVKYHPFGLPIIPSASAEIFHNIDATEQSLIDGIRYQLGTEFLINRKLSVGVDCLFDKEINVVRPITEYILSCSINYSF